MIKRIFTLTILSVFIQAMFVSNLAVAAPAITINSPAEGQKFTGNNFTVSGNTDPNSTVLIQKGTATLKQVISDASGNWSAELSNLPDGNNTITSKVVKSSGYGYFASTPDGGGTTKINRLRFSDDAINPGGNPWPVTSTNFVIGLFPSPVTDIFYGVSNIFNTAAKPTKFDASNPADPVEVGGAYPSNPGTNTPAFNLDGTKVYITNLAAPFVSVVNTATNAWIKDISTGAQAPIAAVTAPNGKVYVSNQASVNQVINTTTDTAESTFTTPCSMALMSFSEDPSYPYYYGFCLNDGKILQLKLADNSVNATFNTGYNPTGGYLTPDNSKIYFFNATLAGYPDSDKLVVVDTKTGLVTNTIQLSSGITGFISSPDGQKLYVATPGFVTALNVNKIDVVDLKTETKVKTITTPEPPIAVTFAPSSAREISIANVSVVLGVSTTSAGGKIGSLAETGAVMISAIGLGALIIVILVYLFIDYRRHKRPLVQEDPKVKYTFAHHLHQVTIPLFKYRLQLMIKPSKAGRFSKF
ncbi:MAG: hypothetical protein NTX11_05005 [Candidatus Saccharibacteria bacterium]|nr:hypothetical protein [Candidatus Saccharibacteria bacterium]